jgi:ornithine cyclodeaminase
MGSDTLDKQELDAQILRDADLVVVDSLSQSQERGEVYQALMSGDSKMDKVLELGSAIASGQRVRTSGDQITVADLTGVAVQDIQIAKVVAAALDAD